MSFLTNIFNQLGKSTSSEARKKAVGDSGRSAGRKTYAKIVAGTFSGLIGRGGGLEGCRQRGLRAERDGVSGYRRGGAVMGVVAVLGGVMLGGAVLGGEEAFATASSLTISVSGSLTINLPPSAEGKFADSGNETISVSTTHAAGYVLKVKASSATDLKNSSGTTGFTSISSAISAETFDTSAYNGKWGYKPSKLNSVANTNYLPAPTTSGSTIDSVSSATNNNYTVSIGARADINTAIGDYSNTFVFTVTVNPTPYKITYDANAGTDTVSGMPSNVSSTTSGNVTISSTEPTREDYLFQGWCTAQVADGASCMGTSYAAGGTFEIDQTASSNNLTLYAMWESDGIALYDAVAAMSKGKNTDSASGFSWTSITTATSGVYEWDGKTAGNGTDSNGGDKVIYFYRGILDNTTGSYGSDGDAGAYPNYVILQSGSNKATTDTCWRIVRTTSTGGVKMIYNGLYGATTTGSCANATTKAQTRYNNTDLTVPFNTSSSTKAGKTYTGLEYNNIHAVGYTYTSSVAAGTTTTKTPAQLFGASGNDTATNDKSSIIKQYIEDWYGSTLTAYTSILEGDAGYCQDRRLNTSKTWTTALSESSNTIVPYGTSSMPYYYYFGAYPRNIESSTFNPLLTCPRGKVDLYSYSGDAGNGNGQLKYPVALLTADEASLGGSGWDNSFSAYNSGSFLRSGSYFWLFSPFSRNQVGVAYEFSLSSDGYLDEDSYVDETYGVRPAISLSPGTNAASGSGTATDPWVVTAP